MRRHIDRQGRHRSSLGVPAVPRRGQKWWKTLDQDGRPKTSHATIPDTAAKGTRSMDTLFKSSYSSVRKRNAKCNEVSQGGRRSGRLGDSKYFDTRLF